MINKSPFFRQFAVSLAIAFAAGSQAQTPAQALFDAGLSGWFSTECTSAAVPPNPDTHKVEYLWQGAGTGRELLQRVMVDQSKPHERLQRRIVSVEQLAPDLFRFNLEVLPKTATSAVITTLRRITTNEHVVIEQSRLDAGGKVTVLAKDGKQVSGDASQTRQNAQPIKSIKPLKRCALSEVQAGALSGMSVQAPSAPPTQANSTTATPSKGVVKTVQVASPDGFSTEFPWGKRTCNTAGEDGVWGLCLVLDDAAKPLPLPAIVLSPMSGFWRGAYTPQKMGDAKNNHEPYLLKALQFGRMIKGTDGAAAFLATQGAATTAQLQAGDVFGYRVQWQNLSRYPALTPEIHAVLETPRGITLKRQAGQFAYSEPTTVTSREMQEEERLNRRPPHVVNREFPLPQSVKAQTRSSYGIVASANQDAMLRLSESYFQVESNDPAGTYIVQVWAGLKLLGSHTFEVTK